MRRSARLLVVSAAVLVLAACGSDATPSANPLPSATPSSAVTSPTPTVTSPVFKVDPDTKLVQPKSFSLGDFRAPAMSKLTWSTWSPTSAVGVGTYEQSVCTDQACASPTDLKTPARITLSGVKKGVFTTMIFASLSSTEIPIDSYTFNGRVWG
jgi:hypothetical protein